MDLARSKDDSMEEDRLLERTKAPSRILNEDLFLYLLDLEVKRARRYQNFLSLLLLNLKQVSKNDGKCFEVCQRALGRLLTMEMRETDILGSLGRGSLAILLPYADPCAGSSARSRFENVLKYYDFKEKGFEVMIDGVCFPVNGADSVDLIRQVMGKEPCESNRKE